MYKRVPLVLALLALMVTGCGYQKTWVANDPMQLTAKPGGYEMPISRGGTDRVHKILGELSVTSRIKPTWSTESSLDLAVKELRKESIRRGADAVINMKTTQVEDDGHTRLTVSGQLILFTGPPPVAARS